MCERPEELYFPIATVIGSVVLYTEISKSVSYSITIFSDNHGWFIEKYTPVFSVSEHNPGVGWISTVRAARYCDGKPIGAGRPRFVIQMVRRKSGESH